MSAMVAVAPPRPDPVEVRRIVLAALIEDLGPGDLTSEVTVPADAWAEGAVVARHAGVAAGLWLVGEVAAAAGEVTGEPRAARVHIDCEEGEAFAPRRTLARIAGPARLVLAAERVTLNLVQRLVGVAALTRRFVEAVAGTGAAIVDTRKTTPGLRALEKYAVRCGGGVNHRMGLYDEAMVKDNHVAVLAGRQGLAPEEVHLADAVRAIRDRRPGARVTVEVDSPAALERALEARPEVILLDNFALEALREAVARVRGGAAATGGPAKSAGAPRPLLEASGGVRLDTVRAIAETGVDRISVGALTHQATAVDIGLDVALA